MSEADDQASLQGALPERELEQLLAAMGKGQPWRRLLEGLGLPTLSMKQSWFTNVDKARFYCSVSARRGDAIDIGAGSGVIAAGLAPHFARVVALEHNPGWCEFMRRRFLEDGVDNVEVIQGSATSLALQPESFDVAVVNGVLEWIPDALPDLTPPQAHRRFLQNVRAMLRPGGVLGVAIENRFNFDCFLGYAPHNEPPYAPVLPRRLANWVTRRAQHHDYRTWIYGYQGYRRLLGQAGFRDIRIQLVMPSYHEPREVLEIGQDWALRPYFQATRKSRAAVLDGLARLGLLGYFVHSFYISART